MTIRALSVSNYNFRSEDRLFFDANIWLFLHGPQQSPVRNRVKTYSQAFKRILIAKSHIHIDVLIVSEFINSYARIMWRNSSSNIDFKRYRNSTQFKRIAPTIASDAELVMQHCSPVESGFARLEINDLLDEYAAGGFDFNDQVITELCKTEGLTLITHDGDFKGSAVPILTANKKLLV